MPFHLNRDSNKYYSYSSDFIAVAQMHSRKSNTNAKNNFLNWVRIKNALHRIDYYEEHFINIFMIYRVNRKEIQCCNV